LPKEINKKGRAEITLPFPFLNQILIYFLKNFFLPYPASPIKPEPRRSMVAWGKLSIKRIHFPAGFGSF
jgi:hypothetical protein